MSDEKKFVEKNDVAVTETQLLKEKKNEKRSVKTR